MDIQEAIQHVLDGRAVLFTGAGFSFGAENIQGQPIPAGRALARRLLGDIGYNNLEGGLDKASSAYLRRYSEKSLVELLIKEFSVQRVSPSHISVGALPWRRVYTTNYDKVIEHASREARVVRSSVEGTDSPRDHLSKPNLVIHLNGDISRLTTDHLHSSFKLLSESYATDSFENSGWAFHFRNDIRTSSAVIFIGYSMYDLDIRRILFNEDIAYKTIFITDQITDENKLDAEDLADLGHLAPIGVDGFAREVEAIKSIYIPRKPGLLLDTWSMHKLVQSSSSHPRDADVIDFLSIGNVKPELLLDACGADAGKYVIPSDIVIDVEHALLNSGKDVLLVGALGTGKSFICQCVAQRLCTRGWQVYQISMASDDAIAELERICDVPGEKLLIVENYQRHLNLLRWVAETNPEGVALLVSARSHIHDLFAAEFYELMSDACLLFDTSEMSGKQITDAVAIFDRYGLWGDRASWPLQRKESFITHDCKSLLPFLLIDVLKSQHVTERFKKLIAEVPNQRHVEAVLICVFALEVMQFTPRVDHIQELLGNRVDWLKLRSQPGLKPIIDFSGRQVNAKSAILANHLLQNIFSAKRVVETLIDMTSHAEARRSETAYQQIFNSLMRYSQISMILPETSKLDSAITYYEGIKNLPSTRSDPQFWLQYAISCLAFGKLERAERYFKDAYEFAKKRSNYNTYQIDNHFARLLLEKALISGTANNSILLLEEARKIIVQQLATEVRHHPYRVALGFFKCYEQLASQLDASQTAYFKRIFEEIKRRAEGASGVLGQDKYVRECLQKATVTLASIQ